MWNTEDDEFFIGYAPPMPPRLARFVKRVVMAIGLAVLTWAGTLAAGHVALAGGTFEFGQPRSFSGTILESPYPAVQLDGEIPGSGPVPLLVAPGKHGADSLVRGLNARHVTFMGTRIERNGHLMIEIDPASLARVASVTAFGTDTVADVGSVQTDEQVELTGEIVDSKCFLGVMVPGSGKTHKDCASLCLRGGIPPALHVEDRAGHSALLLLTGPAGEPIGAPAVLAAGEAVTVTGSIDREHGWLVLRTDPATWRARFRASP